METNDSAATPPESAGQPVEEEGLSANGTTNSMTGEEEAAPADAEAVVETAVADEPEMDVEAADEEPPVEAETESETDDEPQPVVEPEPVAEVEPEPVAEAEPEPEAIAEPQAEAEPQEESGMSDEELFLAALNGDVELDGGDDYSLSTVRRGQIVTGTIAGITNSEVLVDVGAKSEGIITGREFDSLDSETRDSLKVGEDIEVYVLTPESRDGHILLSLRRALEKQDWVEAETYREEETPYEGAIAGFNKGGLIVRFGGLRGFVPASQVSRERRQRSAGATPEERWSEMVGEKMTVKVIEVDRGRNRLILSERAAMAERRAEQRAELMKTLAVGQVISGRVTRLADFGAFVDIGGVDGLVHISEMAWSPVEHPRDVLKPGQEIEVEVINIDIERQRIGLSYKNLQPDPWDTIGDTYKVDQLTQGQVTKITKFGAFARLVDHPAIEGLIHISELAERRVGHPSEIVHEGDVLTLRIIRLDPERRRMGLSLRRVDSEEYLDDDWVTVVDSINEGDDLDDTPEEMPIEDEPAAEAEVVEEEVSEAVEAEAAVAEDDSEVEAEAVSDAEIEAEASVEVAEAEEVKAVEEAEDASVADTEEADEAEAMVEELESEAGDGE